MTDEPVNERLAASMLEWWKDGAKGCDSALHEVTSLLRHLSRDGFVITDVRGFIGRFSYEHFVGPIPDGLQLDHLCRNRICVNPAHLEPVTNRTNSLRGVGQCADNYAKTHCKRGHEFTPENTRQRITRYGTDGRECITCAFDGIARRTTAKHVGEHTCPTCGDGFNTLRGLRVHSSKGHGVDITPHGTRSRYVTGCRCDACRNWRTL